MSLYVPRQRQLARLLVQSGVSAQWITSEAPSALTRSALRLLGRQNLANCNAKTETPPEPCVKTMSPALTGRWPASATQAWGAGQGRSLVVPELLDKASRFR
jgi:hypothetical protein